jgi:hypothetical protein
MAKSTSENLITPAVLNAAQIDTTTIADSSITDDKIVNGTIQGQSIADDTIEPEKISSPGYLYDSVLTYDHLSGTLVWSNTYTYSDADWDARLATKDTDDLSEGTTNLYYTQGRFDTAFSAKDTGDLTEGSNLYYTDARAIAAVEGEPTLDLGNITHSGAWSLTCDNDITIETTTTGDYAWLKTDKTYVGVSSGFFLTNGNEIDTWGGASDIVLKKRVIAEELIVVDNQTADPTGVSAGSIYFNTTTNKFRGYNGTAWVDLG